MKALFYFLLPTIVIAVIAIIYGVICGKGYNEKLERAEKAEKHIWMVVKGIAWGCLGWFLLVTIMDTFDISTADLLII